MTLDERIEALVMSVELISRDVETLRGTVGILRDTVEVDGNNIRALARIAEIHERWIGPHAALAVEKLAVLKRRLEKPLQAFKD